MDLQNLLEIFIGAVATLIFLLLLSGYSGRPSYADAGRVQDAAVAMQVSAQQSVDSPKAIPAAPKHFGSMPTPLPIRIDNPLACYSACVIDCNPRRETPERPCQKRCAANCWHE